jgi:hypothetical protein
VSAGAVGRVARAPQVAVEDEHGAGDWPAEKQVGMMASGAVGGEAVGAHLQPFCDVGSQAGPKKSAFDSVKGLVSTEVAAGWISVERVEDVKAEASGDIYE